MVEKVGTCYEDAWRFLLKEKEGELIHGSVQLTAKGPRVNHAWVELPTGYIWEPQTGSFFTVEDFKIMAPLEEHRYSVAEAAVMAARVGKHGPWTEQERQMLKRGNPDAKEPWQITKAEFAKVYPFKGGADAVHRSAVFGAIYQGKPVPPEVLADYPDLRQSFAPETLDLTKGQMVEIPLDVKGSTPYLEEGEQIARQLGNGVIYHGPQFYKEQFITHIFEDAAVTGTSFAGETLEEAKDGLIEARKIFKAKPPEFNPGTPYSGPLFPEDVPEEDFTSITDVNDIYDLFSKNKISLEELDRLKSEYYAWYYSPERHTTVLRFYRQADGTMTIHKQTYIPAYGEDGNTPQIGSNPANPMIHEAITQSPDPAEFMPVEVASAFPISAKSILSPEEQARVDAFIQAVPDKNDTMAINYWVDLDDKIVYLEGWCDKCLASTGFPGIGGGDWDAKIEYMVKDTKRTLREKQEESNRPFIGPGHWPLIEGGFREFEAGDRGWLYGVTWGVYTKPKGGNPMAKTGQIKKEEALGMLERLSMTPGEAVGYLRADQTERLAITRAVQGRVKKEQNKFAPFDPREGPPLPRFLGGLRWPWRK